MDVLAKLSAYLAQYENGYNNRSAIRYLSKRDPDLWEEICQITAFLPDDAKPKQRVWHIINEVYDRPVCPVTGEFVKWFENRYLTYFSRSAKSSDPQFVKQRMETYCQRTGHTHWHSKDNEDGYAHYLTIYNEGRINGNHKRTGCQWDDDRREKLRQTWLDKYGVDHPWKHPDIIKKSLETRIANGNAEPKTEERDLYYAAVYEITRKSWIDYFDKINPERHKRGSYWHLDHIYSILEGFRNNIPPEIIGHWTNLRMLTISDNSSKGSDCHKTIEELYFDYEAGRQTPPTHTRKPPKEVVVVNWEEVEPLYRAGEIPQKELSAMYGISTRYLNKQAEIRGWGKWKRVRKGWTEESKQRVREAMHNRAISDETRERIKAAAQKRGENMRGKTYEEIYGVEKARERRRKMSESNKGKVRTEEHKANYRLAAAKRNHNIT
jgi:plasmid stability protein